MNKLPTTFARLAAAGLLVLAAGSAQALVYSSRPDAA